MRIVAWLTVVSALAVLGVGARDADALGVNVAQHSKALALGSGAWPGSVFAVGAEAVPLAFGRVGGVKAPVAVASSLERGRAVAVTHQNFFCPGTAKNRENVAFLRECVNWLAGGMPPLVVYVDVRCGGMEQSLREAMKKVKGFRIERFRGYGELAGLAARSVVVTSPDGHPLAEAPKLTEFVRRGGGVLCYVVGWGWQQISGGKSLRDENTFNRALGPVGIYAGGNGVDAERDGTYSVTNGGEMACMTADSALEMAESMERMPTQLGGRCLYQLGALVEVLPRDDERCLPRLNKLVQSAVRAFVPSPERPLSTIRVRERLAYMLAQNAWLADPEKVWPASPAAAVYPGVADKGTARITRDVEVDLSIPRWHGTGLFAVAGEPLTITLPEGMERQGLRVRVGSTTCRVTGHARWQRAPVVDVELPLDKAKTVFASPFGGMVYIVVPDGRSGKTQVTVGPACAAAWYVEGRDTAEAWQKALRDSPAPFVELENDHVAISVPRKFAERLADPAPLLQVWREIMDNDARLTGIPAARKSPERICADVQLCAGYMHAGYPIMMPMCCIGNLLSEPTIRKGDRDDVWGFFHEMGHNHQNGDWTFDGTGEVTVNFFTLYNMQKICGRSIRQTKMGDVGLKGRVEQWNQAGRPLEQWKSDPFLALDFFARLVEKYGWEPFERLFAEYRALPQAERPKTDLEKREQWCRRLSRIVGEDLSPEFRFLGVKPIPAAAPVAR